MDAYMCNSHLNTHSLSFFLYQIQLPKIDSQLSLKIRNIVVGLRTVHPRYLLVHVLRDDSPQRNEFIHLLVRIRQPHIGLFFGFCVVVYACILSGDICVNALSVIVHHPYTIQVCMFPFSALTCVHSYV